MFGFALIGLHGAAALAVAYFALDGSTLERVATAILGLSWLAAWGAWRTLGLAGLGLHGRPRGHAAPPTPDFGSTWVRDARPLRRL